jgi:glyoxylase-like metal-dependent hydrolase (beta-lactamase superfamily II)
MQSKKTELENFRFLNGGYCVQSRYLSGGSSFRFRRFQAVFAYFEHPKHGGCLIDTGYGPDVVSVTKRFPWRLLRWFTPIPGGQGFSQPDYLPSQNLKAEDIQQIFVSHFHADHIGGTKLFPHSKFFYRSDSLDELQSLSNFKKLESGFLPDLLPADFASRGQAISESSFSEDNQQLNPFRTFDFWGDQSLILIDLPGHAIGHTGYLLNTDSGPVLYVVDSFWDRHAFDRQKKLPWTSRRVHESYQKYQQTNRALFELEQRTGLTPLACHCPRTQDHV